MRMERTWIARLVVKSRPELIETETDYLLTIGSSQPAFLALTSPNAFGVVDPGQVTALVSRARSEHRAVFQIGRTIVLAFNGVWESAILVDDLVTLLVRHQLGGPVPTFLPRSRVRRSLRTLRAWVHRIGTAHDREEPTQTLGLPPTPAMPRPTGPGASDAASLEPVAVSVGDMDGA
jgi:hypothetical protein